MRKKIKIFLGEENEGFAECDCILGMDGYKSVEVTEPLQKALIKQFGFDKQMTPAYARRVFDAFSKADLEKYLNALLRTLPDKCIIHTDDIAFAKVAKHTLDADLVRIALYGVNPRIPNQDPEYDSVLAYTNDLSNCLKEA